MSNSLLSILTAVEIPDTSIGWEVRLSSSMSLLLMVNIKEYNEPKMGTPFYSGGQMPAIFLG
jgi:hypothetical protein